MADVETMVTVPSKVAVPVTLRRAAMLARRREPDCKLTGPVIVPVPPRVPPDWTVKGDALEVH